MGSRNFGLVLIASLSTFAVSGDSKTTAWAQDRPIDVAIPDPVAPPPAEPTAPTPDLGPNQFDSTGQPGQNLPLPTVPSSRQSAPTSPVSNTRNTSRNSNQNNSSFSPRLARAAPIMGDSFSPSLVIQDEFGIVDHEFPAGGGASRSKIAENSSSLPRDRLIFNYNHFHNAIDDTQTNSTDVDRFTLGFEKTFHDQMMSIEVRMPFLADNDFEQGGYNRNGSDVGNLSVTLKSVLTSNSDSLCAAGLTIDTPTSGDTILTGPLPQPLVFSNDAVHLSPFLGFLCTPRGGNIHQGFLQIDVPTNANGLTSGATAAELLEQTLLYVDYSFGKQLYYAGRSARGSCDIRRVLGLAELHYTTTLEDSDVVQFGLDEVTSRGNRLDIVNLTLGLHTELANGTQIRFGTVAPITEGDDRFFDVEFQAQLNVPIR